MIHGLKSKAVEVKVVCQGTKDQLGSARVKISSVAGDVRILKEDVTSVEGKITIQQQDMAHIKHEMGLMKSDVTTVRHDLATVKSTVNNINRCIAVIESALVSHCDKWGWTQPFSMKLRVIPAALMNKLPLWNELKPGRALNNVNTT